MESTGKNLLESIYSDLGMSYKKEEQKVIEIFKPLISSLQLITKFKEYNVVLAGGTITSIFLGTQINDLDCFVSNEKSYNILCKAVIEHYGKTKDFIYKETNYATTFYFPFVNNNFINNKYILQLIYNPKIEFETGYDLINKFDFTICQAFWNFKTMNFGFGTNFLKHLIKRELVVNENCSSLWSILYRLKKYEKKGFEMSKEELTKLIGLFMINKIETKQDFIDAVSPLYTSNSPETLSKQLFHEDELEKPFNKQDFERFFNLKSTKDPIELE